MMGIMQALSTVVSAEILTGVMMAIPSLIIMAAMIALMQTSNEEAPVPARHIRLKRLQTTHRD